MILITTKRSNEIVEMASDSNEGKSNLAYLPNGYPMIVSLDIAWIAEEVDVFQGVDVDDGVEKYKYCYTEEKGFYENPNWLEPEEPIEHAKYTLDEAAAIIASEVANNE